MLSLSLNKDKNECETEVKEVLKNGKALEKFYEIIVAQGGDINKLPKATNKIDVVAQNDGFISKMDTEKIGRISSKLGAGRMKKEDSIDYSAGIILKKKYGEYVKKNDVIAEFYTSSLDKETLNIESLKQEFIEAVELSNLQPEKEKIIYEIIE